MKYKVSELEGALLDAAVAKAKGLTLHGRWWRKPDSPDTDWCEQAYFDPSKRWRVGGPIIERERITVQASQAGDWRAFLGDGTTNAGTGRRTSEPLVQARGETPLVAAMRAYVASKLGEAIDL